jgi:hypothetical protein
MTLRITRLKFLPDPPRSYKRQYLRCKKHNAFAYYDYLPFSLSTGLMDWMACRCSPYSRDGEIAFVDEQEGMRGLLDQQVKRVAASRQSFRDYCDAVPAPDGFDPNNPADRTYRGKQ